MARAAGFAASWLKLDADLAKVDLLPFNRGLTTRQKLLYTVGVAFAAAVVALFLNGFSALIILGTGAWVIWNPGDKVTRVEKKVFLTNSILAVYFAFMVKFAVFLNLLFPFTILAILFIVLIWRR